MSDERQGLVSASVAPVIMLCPARLQRGRACPPEPVSNVTNDGTIIHLALETGDTSALTKEQLEIYNRIIALRDNATDEWRQYYSLPDAPYTLIREERLWIRRRDNLSLLASAKLDYAIIIEGYASLWDYKTGFKDVEAAEINAQVMTQALSLWHEYPNLTNIRGGTISCRLGYKVDFVDYGREDLINAERKLSYALWQAYQPDPPAHPGKWCRYCPAKAYCQEALAWSSLDLAIPTKLPIESKADAKTAVSLLPVEALVKIHEKASIIEAILTAAKARLKSLPEDELTRLGYRLKPGKKTRKPLTVFGAVNKLKTYLFENQIDECLSLSYPDLEKKIAEVFSLKTEASKKKLEEILGEITTITEGEKILDKL